jgi:hypothetical protein
MTPTELLDSALSIIESPSIKDWVERQRYIWLKIAAAALKNHPNVTKEGMAINILSEALG